MAMRCRISRELLVGLRAETAAADGREICGLLLGKPGLIETAWPIPNAAPDGARAFLLDPAAHLAAQRRAREEGRVIVGHYHSHPAGLADPSATDADGAGEQGRYWLIVAAKQARLWISRKGGASLAAFDPIELDIA
jgi:proteasome lid subunit RPN8/RPN11